MNSDIGGMTLELGIPSVVRPRSRRAGVSARRTFTPSLQRPLIYPLLPVVLSLPAFRQGSDHAFTNWDDLNYIVENPVVQGLTLERIGEAFTSFTLFNYNPLHLVSYMVDHEIWGLRAGGFFCGSLVLHIAAGLCVYFFAARWLRSPAACWLVAALFLLHPTRIESVAWLSERKDVLSGAFGAAAVLVWARRLDPRSRGNPAVQAAAAWLLYLLALLSKSQLVGLPLVLLFMDLARSRPALRAVATLIPFFALSALFSAISVRAHAGDASLGVTFPESITGPLAALPRYLLRIVAPIGLSPYYDFQPGEFSALPWVVAGAVALALLCAGFAYAWKRDREYCLHMIWFLALLAPVIGFFRIRILIADRYLYFAVLGPLLAAARMCLLGRSRLPRPAAMAGVASVAACLLLSSRYVEVFTDSETLWQRVLASFPESSIAHSNLGHYLLGRERIAEAAEHYDRDLASLPTYETSLLGRALIHEKEKEPEAARRLYEIALEKRPLSPRVRVQFADFLERTGDPAGALALLDGLEPDQRTGEVERRISELELGAGRFEEAAAAARLAILLSPADARNHHALGVAEEARGRTPAALEAYERAVALAPGFLPAAEAVERIRARANVSPR